jgi:hypothetical protein
MKNGYNILVRKSKKRLDLDSAGRIALKYILDWIQLLLESMAIYLCVLQKLENFLSNERQSAS